MKSIRIDGVGIYNKIEHPDRVIVTVQVDGSEYKIAEVTAWGIVSHFVYPLGVANAVAGTPFNVEEL